MEMSKKKPQFELTKCLENYLLKYNRYLKLPISYADLTSYSDSLAVLDSEGRDTLWRSVIYSNLLQDEVQKALLEIYALLKTDGDDSFVKQLAISNIDYCLFGNSNPFRIRVINLLNDNHDYYYIKKTDASRICGLELEDILSPNKVSYMVDGKTMVEEHIAGIPGDVFMKKYTVGPNFSKIRMAKEFVKFNERCFTTLLGDMRSYNYVIDVTPDFDMEQYRVRPIDFDQLIYEGRKNHYRPQFYKENKEVVQFCMETLTPATVDQYQTEERTLIRKRYMVNKARVENLLDCMVTMPFSTAEKITSLCSDLNEFHRTDHFNGMDSMGKVLRRHLHEMIDRTQHLHYSGKTSFK
jgi:hypothetical protein